MTNDRFDTNLTTISNNALDILLKEMGAGDTVLYVVIARLLQNDGDYIKCKLRALTVRTGLNKEQVISGLNNLKEKNLIKIIAQSDYRNSLLEISLAKVEA